MKKMIGVIGVLCLIGVGAWLTWQTTMGNKTEQADQEVKESKEGTGKEQSTEENSSTTETPKEDPIKKRIAALTLEEKVGQLFLARVPENNPEEMLRTYPLGGYLLFGRDMENQTENTLQQKIAAYQAASSLPLFIASDEEGGTVSRLSAAGVVSPAFRSPMSIYNESGIPGIQKDIEQKAAVFHRLGIHLGLAPDADVATDPQAFIYDRTIGRAAEETGEYVAASVAEIKKQQMGSTLKHFPGYGNNRDSHVEIVTDDRPLSELQENDFIPFEKGIAAGADSIMVSHNIIQAIDGDRPASISPRVHQVIREELGFKKVIMTDDMDMAGLADFISQDEAGLQALQAGNDMILSSSFDTQIPYIVQAVKNGSYSEQALDQSVYRVLEWKTELGLLKET